MIPLNGPQQFVGFLKATTDQEKLFPFLSEDADSEDLAENIR